MNLFTPLKLTSKSTDLSRVKTIPLKEKLTRKKRKLISVRLRILYNSLSTLDFDVIKSLRTCKKNLKKTAILLDNYLINSDFLETCIGSMLDSKVFFLKKTFLS